MSRICVAWRYSKRTWSRCSLPPDLQVDLAYLAVQSQRVLTALDGPRHEEHADLLWGRQTRGVKPLLELVRARTQLQDLSVLGGIPRSSLALIALSCPPIVVCGSLRPILLTRLRNALFLVPFRGGLACLLLVVVDLDLRCGDRRRGFGTGVARASSSGALSLSF